MATVQGTASDDVLAGSEGADSFVFDQGHGDDVIVNFELGTDIIRLRDRPADAAGHGRTIVRAARREPTPPLGAV